MTTKILKSSQEQASSAWIEYLRILREEALIDILSAQDVNLEKALKTLNEIKEFIASPEHILGSFQTKHGEVAEHMQVGFVNAEQLIQGKAPTHTFEGVGRLAMEDYLRDGKMIQSKFYNGVKGTFQAVCKHLGDYPQFISEGGTYDIPKDQYEQLMDIYHRGETLRSSLHTSEETLFKNMKAWEAENGVSIKEVVKPAVVGYDEVQLGVADKTIDTEQGKVKDLDERIRGEAQDAAKPTLQEGVKATIAGAALEGAMTFAIKVIQIRKSGKKFSEFTEEDWKSVGIDTALGAGKGAIRGATVYTLTNFTPVPSPIASAMVTASFGMVAQARKLHNGDIDKEEFLDNTEILCLDVAVSALSSMLGEVLIPIPILGTLIGNTVGMFMLEISKVYLGKAEQKLIEKYRAQYMTVVKKLNEEYQSYVIALNAEIEQYNSLVALAFDGDANTRFELTVDVAQLAGVDTSKILKTDEERDAFFSTSDCN